MYYCYLLQNEFDRTYIGMTNDLQKRLMKHNSGNGAKSTRGFVWHFACTISGFNTKSDPCKFEYKWKYNNKKRVCGLQNRINRVYEICNDQNLVITMY